jgi:hypothetical protein
MGDPGPRLPPFYENASGLEPEHGIFAHSDAGSAASSLTLDNRGWPSLRQLWQDQDATLNHC